MNSSSHIREASDAIVVSNLELSAHVGVPDFEREHPQRLTLNLTVFPKRGFHNLGDDLNHTVDYFALTRRIRKLAAERPRKLIETLVEEIAECILGEFAVAAVEVELRKYILPDTEFVAVRVMRTGFESPTAGVAIF
ncbi:MAG: phosphoglycolate phosphatase/dihydroneopterin aldolase [Verrucomicrobia bacterium]|nr:MAG: phosphoglycolate phosphatase/dihydroneopterin aldolase [Verrucomicrobiota bacterium]